MDTEQIFYLVAGIVTFGPFFFMLAYETVLAIVLNRKGYNFDTYNETWHVPGDRQPVVPRRALFRPALTEEQRRYW